MKWCASSAGKIFEGDNGETGLVVYYSIASGSTHLLNEAGVFIMEQLAATALTAEQLLERMAAAVDDMSAAELEGVLQELLAELESYELIEAA